MPGLRGVEHVGVTVPDVAEAARFFIEVLGCEPVYESTPGRAPPEVLRQRLHVDPRSVLQTLRFLRCGHGPNIELLQYSTPEPPASAPRNSDTGAQHMALYVDDIQAAVDHLRAHGVEVMGEPLHTAAGPSEGTSWVYFRAPWGTYFELVSFPNGKGYEKTTQARLWHPADPAR
jgi:catechol 2,3-dioxygenase-like lactoylglutathione lyase family enzyme